MTIKILNLYAGIGGNRKLWNGDIEVTAIENNPEIAKIYQDFFPNDKVIVCDAHQYLLEHFKEFDFIWSSPPCPSHSRARFWASFGENRTLIYPDMKLYQEILFLQHYFKGKWIVENVKPYYKPLIEAQERGRHLFWSNFIIEDIKSKTLFFPKDSLPTLEKVYGISLKNCNPGIDKRVILRNMVNPELGLHIFEMAFKKPQLTLFKEKELAGVNHSPRESSRDCDVLTNEVSPKGETELSSHLADNTLSFENHSPHTKTDKVTERLSGVKEDSTLSLDKCFKGECECGHNQEEHTFQDMMQGCYYCECKEFKQKSDVCELTGLSSEEYDLAENIKCVDNGENKRDYLKRKSEGE